MGDENSTLWLFRSSNTISSGFEEFSLSEVRASHDPAVDQHIKIAKTWRQEIAPVLETYSLTFTCYRPFIEPFGFLDLNLNQENLSMFFKFTSSYNGIQSYGTSKISALQI